MINYVNNNTSNNTTNSNTTSNTKNANNSNDVYLSIYLILTMNPLIINKQLMKIIL